ncbi:hypothetical protein Q8F55_006870 [Vanrija albida]|uniref:JmjC domain-containing protein n=1 Tax=Vanrija albida TaxID=181172 RepID=A0ABR3PZ36_9TREE
MSTAAPAAVLPEEGSASPQHEVTDDRPPSQNDDSTLPVTAEVQPGADADMDPMTSKDADGADGTPSAEVRELSPPVEDDLAPLPKEFDPDAPTPVVTTAPLPDDDLAIRRDPTPEPELAVEATVAEEQAPADAMDVDDADPYAQDASLVAGEEDRAGVLTAITSIQWPAGFEEEEEALNDRPVEEPMNDEQPIIEGPEQAPEEEIARRRSPSPELSPLSPLSELPSEFIEEVAPAPTPAPVAESSKAAQRRSASPGKRSPGDPSVVDLTGAEGGRSKRKGKAPERFGGGSADFGDLDDDFEVGPKGKRIYKKAKGLDGKPIKKEPKSRKRLDQDLGISRDGELPPEKVVPRAKTLTDVKIKEMLKGKDKEVQLAPCIRPRYGRWGKCTQCVSKVGGDSCRFRTYRTFPIDPATAEIQGPGFFESTQWAGEMTPLPQRFNTELTEEHMVRTERTVAAPLLNLVTGEMRHVLKHRPLLRGVDSALHRSVCDFCASTIFGGFFFCKKCGRDYCLECERFFSSSSTELRDSPWALSDAARPRLQRCTREGDEKLPSDVKESRRSHNNVFMHSREDLVPVSRFSAKEIKDNWLALIDFVLEPQDDKFSVEDCLLTLGVQEEETELADAVREYFQSEKSKRPAEAPVPALAAEDVEKFYEASKHLPSVPDPTDLKTHPFIYIDAAKLDNDKFDVLWARGEPMVAYGVEDKFLLDWSPDGFIKRFGSEPCYVLECQTEVVKKMTVGQFFQMFKDPALRELHVQDWPKLAPTPMPSHGAVQLRSGPGSTISGRSRSPSVRALSPVKQVGGANGVNGARYPSDDRSRQTSPVKDAGATSDTSRPRQASPLKNGSEVREASPPKADHTVPHTNGAPKADNTRPHTNGTNEEEGVNGSNQPGKAASAEETKLSDKTDGAEETMLSEAADPEVTHVPKKIKPGIFKLKDWPSTDDFEFAYPDLYNDFNRALPVPDFTRRDGVLNLYSHFPAGPTRPDIGPKMYNAFAAREEAGGMGSTRLHMDVADAVNIMLHASKRDDGTPGCAVWDLYKAEDADTLRLYLKNKFADEAKEKAGKPSFTDPIHAQMFYLDAEMRKELFDKHGVTSFRVYQYPGQAVFIPAGCAHQVCNLADCIKIALDFVSPHNTHRCQQLVRDFRRENFLRAWKDDVLQLYNVMWYAWTNVRETRQRRAQAAAVAASAQAARHAHLASLANGNSAPFTLRAAMSPSRNLLSPAMSSVRDDPAPPSPRERVENEAGSGVGSAGRPSGPSSPAPAPRDGAPDSASTETDMDVDAAAPSPKQILADKLFAAALAREPIAPALDLDPRKRSTPPPLDPSPPRQQPAQPREKAKLVQVIQRGHAPLGLAYDALTRDLGSGADELP